MIMVPYNCSSHRCSSQAAWTSGTPQAPEEPTRLRALAAI